MYKFAPGRGARLVRPRQGADERDVTREWGGVLLPHTPRWRALTLNPLEWAVK